MKKQRSALGKGLNALLPASEGVGSDGFENRPYFICPLESITPNPNQPRKDIEDESLRQLAASIHEKGVLLPLVVSVSGDDSYEIIAGERRWRAAQLAGLEEVPVIVKDVSPLDRFELALIENIQRQDLSPLEEAEAYKRLVQEFGLTQEEVARRVGKERSTVANMLRILQLPDSAKEDLSAGRITMGHARVLLSLDDEVAAEELRNEIIEKGLNVRQTEAWAKRRKKKRGLAQRGSGKRKVNQLPESYCRALTNDLVRYLGTKSKITQNGSRGKLEIEYYSPDDLERLLGLITGNR